MALGDLVNSGYDAVGSGDTTIVIPWTPGAGNTIVLAVQRIASGQTLTPTGYTQHAAVVPIQGPGNTQHTVWNDGWWAHGQVDTTIEITQVGDEGKLVAIWELEGEVEPYLTDEQSWPDRGCSGPWTMTVGELDVDRPTVLLGASVLRFAQTAVMAPGDVVPTDGVESEPGTEGDVLHPMWAGYERVEAGFHLWEIVVQDPAVGADCLRGQSAWLAAFDVSGPTPPVTPPLVCAVDDTDLSELVCIDAEDLVDWKIRVELQGTGSGYIVIHRSHLAADTDVIKKGNWLAVKIPQIDDEAIFVFQMERITTTLISADEGGGETLQVAGRGNLSYFDRAIALPRTYASGSGESDLSVDGIINGPAATGNKAGQVLERAMREWQHVDRGVSDFGLRLEPIQHVTHDFDYDDDSNGDPWDTTDMTGELSLGYVGEKGLVGILELIGTGAIDIIIWPTFLLQAFNQFGRDLTGTDFGADVVRFVRGVNIAEQLVRDEGLVVDPTHTVVQGSDGSVTAWAFAESPVYGSQPHVEGHVSTFGTDLTALEAVGVAEMARRIRQGESIQFRVATPRFGNEPDLDNGIYLPGPEGTNGNYWLGDFVTLDTGSGFRDYANLSVRVMAITITTDDAGDLEVIVELKGTTLNGRLIPATGSFGGFAGGGGSLGGSGSGGTGGSSPPPPPPGAGVAGHVADPDDAHNASAISVVPFETIAATNVQAALEEIFDEAAGGDHAHEPPTPGTHKILVKRTSDFATAASNDSVPDYDHIIVDTMTDPWWDAGDPDGFVVTADYDGLDAIITARAAWADPGSSAYVEMKMYYFPAASGRNRPIDSGGSDEQYLIGVEQHPATDNVNHFIQLISDPITVHTGDRIFVALRTSNSQTAIEYPIGSDDAPVSITLGAYILASPGPEGPPGALTVEDEGTPLATDATTLDFVGAGVVASGTGAEKTITISGAPTGAAGGDLSGTYPNPSVVDDSHSHTTATAPGGVGHGPILLESGHAVPFTFDEILQESDGSDFLYASA